MGAVGDILAVAVGVDVMRCDGTNAGWHHDALGAASCTGIWRTPHCTRPLTQADLTVSLPCHCVALPVANGQFASVVACWLHPSANACPRAMPCHASCIASFARPLCPCRAATLQRGQVAFIVTRAPATFGAAVSAFACLAFNAFTSTL